MVSFRKKNFATDYPEMVINGDACNFKGRDLSEANFKEFIIQNVDFSQANLQGTNFREAKLLNVKMEEAKTGMSGSQVQPFKILSYCLALFSGITASYSLDFLFTQIYNPITSQETFDVLSKALFSHSQQLQDIFNECTSNSLNSLDSGTLSNQLIVDPTAIGFVIWIFILLAIAIFLVLKEGLRILFISFILSIILISFLIQAFVHDDNIAKISVIGLACFIGSITSVLVHAQSVYLARELNLIISSKMRIYRLNIIAVLGSLVGALLASSHFNLSWPSSIPLIISGFYLSKLAMNEKLEPNSSYKGSKIKPSRKARNQGSKNSEIFNDLFLEQPYFLVRIIFENILKRQITSFRGAEIKGGSLKNTNLKRADFPEGSTYVHDDVDLEGTGKKLSGRKYPEILDETDKSKEYIVNITGDRSIVVLGDKSMVSKKVEINIKDVNAGGNIVVGDGASADSSGSTFINRPVALSNEKIQNISEIISSLRDLAQSFPEEHKEDALLTLEDLERDISGSDKEEHNVKRVGLRLKKLMAAAAAALIAVSSGTAEFTDNTDKVAEHILGFTNKLEQLADNFGLSIEQNVFQSID